MNQVSEVDESVPEKAGSLKTNDAVSIRGVTEVPRDEELRLLRKFDWLLLPPLTFMYVYAMISGTWRWRIYPDRYLCNALDKGNVGNAKTDGWDKVDFRPSRVYYCHWLLIIGHSFDGWPSKVLRLSPHSTFSAASVKYYLLVMVFYVSLLNVPGNTYSLK